MAAYDMLIDLAQKYFVSLGYDYLYVEDYFSNKRFKELISIRLANANVMIRNKTDRSSHQTHIAITGEAIDFFYNQEEFSLMDNKAIDTRKVYISTLNLNSLNNVETIVEDVQRIDVVTGWVTLGKRTQKQVQLSKRNSENSECFNMLRLGLFENDLLIMLNYRNEDAVFAVGIPQTFYLDYIPNYAKKYETNTYLRLPMR